MNLVSVRLKKRRLYHRCVLCRLYHRYTNVFLYINGFIDYNFNTKRNSDVHSYNTRKKDNFRLPLVKRDYGKQRLLYQRLNE